MAFETTKRFVPDSSLRREFADDEHWATLAKSLYVRLPLYGTKPTDEAIRRWLRKFRVSEKDYLGATGYAAIADFREHNPDWPLRAFVGLLIEYVVERDAAKGVLRAYDRA